MSTAKAIIIALLIGAAIGIFVGVITTPERRREAARKEQAAESTEETETASSSPEVTPAVSETPEASSSETEEYLTEVASEKTVQAGDVDTLDSAQEAYHLMSNSDYPKNEYISSAFKEVDGIRQYTDTEHYTSRIGVDVSEYNGEIDWAAVRQAGFEFAFIRLGYRGYEGGKLFTDEWFEENLAGAREAGLDVGVYFFSQAITEEEAREEAEFVVEQLDGRELELPVMYDPEAIGFDEARTDETTGREFSTHALVFCKAIEDAGYEAGYYANLKWEVVMMDMGALKDYVHWYAGYEQTPSTPYAFTFWQYSDQGVVPGIAEYTDLDLEMIPAK